MEKVSLEKAQELLNSTKKITFLTGAGVSTPSGVPDYRSLNGVYHNLDTPEYLLSVTCFLNEGEKFYHFVKKLYHPTALPNIIHEKIAKKTLAGASLVTQNIDGLHEAAGTKNMVAFHGTLSDLYCTNCGQTVSEKEYLTSDKHQKCGGQIRPNIILYEQQLPEERIAQSLKMVSNADLVVVCGTSFKVYPFAGLLQAKKNSAKLLVINQEEIGLGEEGYLYLGPAEKLFATL